MSWSEHRVQDHRRGTDRAIRRAFAQLAPDPSTLEQFRKLLVCVRMQAPRLFEAPICGGRHAGVDALVNLSRFSSTHVRSPDSWIGNSLSWRPAVSSLAHHLISDYEVPAFLASAWHATDTNADQKRCWFVSHSRGASFRSLDLPVAMTRKMEHIFLASQHHLPIEHAFRRAELLALSVPAEFVKAIMSTRLATDLRHSEFWRTVWMFLVANVDDLDPNQIAPMIDYIQAVRHDRTQDGMIEFGSAQPEFSMKGRTVQSMLRLMKEWHRSLGAKGPSLSWAKSSFEPFIFIEPSRDGSEISRRWQMMELMNSAQLRREGAALHHCVASYADRCYRGNSSIWSLRFWQAEKIHHVLTVEVDPRRRAVIQARGRANRAASGGPLRLLQDWAAREKLRMSI